MSGSIKSLPKDYLERLYAGVLGKVIGVYLGRPFENWPHKDIMAKLGEVDYYVHEKVGHPLVVTDDDISGTFTFIRALEDHGCNPELSAADIGRSWLNYIVRNRTILWWGGMGVSTEHTAYMRLIAGVDAPKSGSIELNGHLVAEQIGSQIFIDGWGLVNPGDPERAAALARKAASVSHDGEAIHGAVVVAAMVAQAFVEPDLQKLLDVAVGLIPGNCVIRRVIDDLRNCRAKHDDWHKGFELIEEKYNNNIWGGGVHMVPNHAVIQLGLLWGRDDFQESLKVANTAGFDTDCNSGNVGCIMGVKLGLGGIDAGPDFRGPVADRVLLPTADGGACVNDAVRLTYRLAKMAGALRGQSMESPKNGARWHFSLPGSVQGWMPEDAGESRGAANVRNVGGRLQVAFERVCGNRVARAGSPVFVTPEQAGMGNYSVYACPQLSPGQRVRSEVGLEQATGEVRVRLYARRYGVDDAVVREVGAWKAMRPGERAVIEMTVPETGGTPYLDVGIEVAAPERAMRGVSGALAVDFVAVEGEPDVTYQLPENAADHAKNRMFQRQWVDAADVFHRGWGGELFRVANDGPGGMILTGTADWRDYTVSTRVYVHMGDRALLCARVGGLKRCYALVLDKGKFLRLIKNLNGHESVLAETAFDWKLHENIDLELTVKGSELRGTARDTTLTASDRDLSAGGIALGVDAGRVNIFPVRVKPAV